MFSTVATTLFVLALTCACATDNRKPVQAPKRQDSSTADAPAVSLTGGGRRLSALPIEEQPALRRYFSEERVTGTIALFDTLSPKLVCSDASKCKAAYIPASTFKIANAIVALETEVVEDPETKLPWDGREYAIADWNQDHTLRTGMRVSCVPCFQEIARKIGLTRMKEWITRLEYGNQNLSGGVDRFWLQGALRISPVEQLDFLQRLDAGKLPIQERNREFICDILTLDVGPAHVLRGKSGLARKPQDAMDAAWFVGWVELGERRVYFALLLDGHEPGVEIAPLRRRLTERILRELGVLGA